VESVNVCINEFNNELIGKPCLPCCVPTWPVSARALRPRLFVSGVVQRRSGDATETPLMLNCKASEETDRCLQGRNPEPGVLNRKFVDETCRDTCPAVVAMLAWVHPRLRIAPGAAPVFIRTWQHVRATGVLLNRLRTVHTRSRVGLVHAKHCSRSHRLPWIPQLSSYRK
jgi:hypothetical protein